MSNIGLVLDMDTLAHVAGGLPFRGREEGSVIAAPLLAKRRQVGYAYGGFQIKNTS